MQFKARDLDPVPLGELDVPASDRMVKIVAKREQGLGGTIAHLAGISRAELETAAAVSAAIA
jgi:hypothetical protein